MENHHMKFDHFFPGIFFFNNLAINDILKVFKKVSQTPPELLLSHIMTRLKPLVCITLCVMDRTECKEVYTNLLQILIMSLLISVAIRKVLLSYKVGEYDG